jgi:hypothetical protein
VALVPRGIAQLVEDIVRRCTVDGKPVLRAVRPDVQMRRDGPCDFRRCFSELVGRLVNAALPIRKRPRKRTPPPSAFDRAMINYSGNEVGSLTGKGNDDCSGRGNSRRGTIWISTNRSPARLVRLVVPPDAAGWSETVVKPR